MSDKGERRCKCGHTWNEHEKPTAPIPRDICPFPCLRCECTRFDEAGQTTTNNPVAQPAGVEGAVELLPCPFCGIVPPIHPMDQTATYHPLFQRNCPLGTTTIIYPISVWNTRATPTDLAERAHQLAQSLRSKGMLRADYNTEGDLDCIAEQVADIITAEFQSTPHSLTPEIGKK